MADWARKNQRYSDNGNFSHQSTTAYMADAPASAADMADDPASDEMRLVFQWMCYTVLGQSVALFGIVTNIINIVCFIKQGFKDTVNISLLALAISDLCSLVAVTWTNTCYNPALQALDLSFEPIELHLLIGTWPHLAFTHVTSWITAFITLERCLCLTLPLKVKTIFTPRRVSTIMICMFVTLTAAVVPVYFANRYGLKLSTSRNRTLLGLIFIDGHENVDIVSYALNNVLIPFSAFLTVIICTICLVVNLKMKATWRKKFIVSEQLENLSNRDQRVARMMVTISTLFIVCFFPVCIFFIAMITVPQLSMGGRYQNTLIILGSVGFLLESTNAAVNIFIYYHMSSRYRAALCQMLSLRSHQ